MTPLTADTLRALIAQGESETLEFKRSKAELNEIVTTVTAMANSRGGRVIIGVHDDGRIIGMDIGKVTKEQITNKITDNTNPAIYPSIEVVTTDERAVIVITVAESDNKPHLANGMPYKRVGASNKRIDRDEYERLLLQRRQLGYDQREVPEATLDDIDEATLRWYLEQAAQERGIPVNTALPVMENLRRLEVVNERDGRPVLTTAALLVFGKHPQRFAPQSKVRLARFQGSLPLNFIDRLDCAGTLPEMIDEAERFIRRNTRIAAKITGFERREITEYPYSAVREAIANAVAHRDYNRADVEVRVSIFDDRIEVQSPGRLPAPLTLESLGEGYALRNPVIAQLLFNIRYIERWNTGIRRMRDDMRRHGLPEPTFTEVSEMFRVTFQGPGEHILDLIPEVGVTDLRAAGLNERQVEALRLMINEGVILTNRQYREMFQVASRTALRDLDGLVDTGWVRQVVRGRSTGYSAGTA